ncbi:MAG TPA: SPFH domain-containing protein, partial [Sphingomonas sp.]
VFQLKQPQETVRATVESAMRAVLATTRFQQAIGDGRIEIEARVAELSQQILDDYQSGVRIQGVSINRATAPQQIVEAFNDVTAAQQDAAAALNNAQSYSSQKIAQAQGAAAEFDQVYEQYRLAPDVTRRRLYYETMEAVLAKSDKTIIEAPGVVPYLPLDRARGAPEPQVEPAAPAAGAAR